MDMTKKVKIFATLCLILVTVTLVKSVIEISFGFRIFLFEPNSDSETKELQALFNFFADEVIEVLPRLPMYVGLLAFYFSGAIGKGIWAKVLLAILIFTFFADIVISFGFGISTLFRTFQIPLLIDEPWRSIYDFWFIPFGQSFFRLIPFIAVCYSATALVAKRVSISVAMAPALAAFAYMIIGYAYLRSSKDLPDYFALAIYIGLTALFFGGAIGRSIWAKLLFGCLALLFVFTFSILFIVNSVYFLILFEIGSSVPGSGLFGWFAALGGIKYFFIPLFTLVFGIAVIAQNKDNVLVGIFCFTAGILYIVSSLVPASANPFTAQIMGDLLRLAVVLNFNAILWAMVVIALTGISKIAKPFLIITTLISFATLLIGSYRMQEPLELFALAAATLVVITFIHLVFTFYIWNAVDDGKAAITPALAVGGGMIPFIGTLWSMIVLSQFPKAYDDYVDRKNLAANYISRTTFWAFIVFFLVSIVLFWIPYVGKIAVFMTFISLIGTIVVGCSAIDRLVPEVPDVEKAVDTEAVLSFS